MASRIDSFFAITERKSDLRTEILGGLTTFITMAYIIVVNPAILSFAGFPIGPSTSATILTSIFGCSLMGLYANLPVAVAPYMGENAFIAFGLASMGVSWQVRLGAVFISGLGFVGLSLSRIRSWLAESISPSMKHSFAVGIGLFLSLIGMYETGIITSGAAGMPAAALSIPGSEFLKAPPVPVKIGNFHDPQVLLAVFGFVLIAILQIRKVKGSILIGMAVNTCIGVALGLAQLPKGIVAMPFQGDYSLAPIAMHLDIAGALKLSFFPILLTLFLMSFLDTLGTLVAVGSAAGMTDKDGNIPNVEKPMLVDSLSCVFSSLVGSSTSGAFIESATGIREGARTGLAALVTALLFACSLFFIPLIEPVQQLKFAYAPALIVVGLLMMQSVAKVEMEDLSELVPAFTTIVMIIFTYNIANGLTAGLILYPVVKALSGKWKDIRPGAAVLAFLCLIYYVFGLPH